MVKKRQSGIELMRTILLIQIVFLHISQYGGYEKTAMALEGTHKLLFLGQWLLCRCPVPLLFMLSGYFSVEKKPDIKGTLKKCFSVHNMMLFYSISITLFCIIAYNAGLDIDGLHKYDEFDIWRAFFPFLNRTWFFMSNYLIVLFLSPYLNMMLSKLTKKQYTLLTAGLFFMLTIWTNLTRIDDINKVIKTGKVIENGGGKSLYMAIFLYILGGYVKRFAKERKRIDYVPLIIFFALWGLNLTLTYHAEWYERIYKQSDNPIVIIQCVLLVLFFRSLNFSSNIVNKISGANIAVYLIHEHHLMRSIIWAQFPQLAKKAYYRENAFEYIIKIWAICIGVYAVCNIIEQLRLAALKQLKKIGGKKKKTPPKTKVREKQLVNV